MNVHGALDGIRVVKGEGRYAVAVCGRLLAQLGADVVSGPSDADVAIGGPEAMASTQAAVRCAISATGSLRHPDIAPDAPEIVMQALGGLMSTSGNADGAPEPVRIPILEAFTGIDAAASVLAALRVAETTGRGQAIDAAVWDTNASLLGTFVALATTGKAAGYRDGARHSICSPWNAYAARDGYVMICTSSDAQWRKLLDVMEQGAKAADAAFIDMNARHNNIAAVDALVEAWTRKQSVAELAPLLKKNGIPAGAIAADAQADAGDLPFNLTASGAPVTAPRSAVRGGSSKALDGVRVIEIGPFTAGPLVGRSLGDLGADIVKIEPDKGEVSRGWSPRAGHVSGYFANYNIGKKSLVLDLSRDADRTTFETLLASADVLVQNLKAGALDKLGFGAAAVTARHRRLIYCSISGYGQDGAPDAALDTVIQAESGIMAKVGDGAMPCKVGFSVADLIAGHLSVLGILAALRRRDRDGVGQQVDVSMLAALQWLMAQGRDYPTAAFDGAVVKDDRAEWVLRRANERDVPVRDLGAVFADPTLKARGMLRQVPSSGGVFASVIGSPYQLALTPPVPGAMIGEAGADRDGVMRAWSMHPAVQGAIA